MKRITTFLLVALIVGLLFSPATQAEKIVKAAGEYTALIATSQVYDTSTTIDVGDWEYIGLALSVEVLADGDAGAGLFWIEGGVEDADGAVLVWEKVWFINYGDSLDLVQSVVIDTEVDVAFHAAVISPIELEAVGADVDDALDNQISLDCTWLPYTKLRCVTEDTNWDASATIKKYWLLKPAK